MYQNVEIGIEYIKIRYQYKNIDINFKIDKAITFIRLFYTHGENLLALKLPLYFSTTILIFAEVLPILEYHLQFGSVIRKLK